MIDEYKKIIEKQYLLLDRTNNSLDTRLKKYELNLQKAHDEILELSKRIELLSDEIYYYKKPDSVFVYCLIVFVFISGVVTSLVTLSNFFDGITKITKNLLGF